MVKFNLDNFILFESEMLEEDTAYHGSPYDFKEFDTAFMGKGEGAQAHGWGLYFSLTPDTVYRRYTGRITNRRRDAWTIITYKGKTFEKGSQGYAIFKTLMDGGKDKAINVLKDSIPYYEKKNNPKIMEQLKELEQIIKGINEDQLDEIRLTSGQNYTVEIPDVKTYLNEDKKFNQQPANVKQALNDIWKAHNLGTVPKDETGDKLYRILRLNLGENRYDTDGPKKASLELYKHGVPGIFYNGYSDGKCVVIFNGKDVKIIKKDYENEKDYIEMDPTNIEFLTDEDIEGMSKVSQELQDALIEKRPELFKLVKNPSEESILKMLRKDPTYFKFIDENLQTPEMQDIAVKQDIDLVQYCKNPSRELINWCLNKDSKVIDLLQDYDFTKNDIMIALKGENPTFILESLVKNHSFVFSNLHDKEIESADFINTLLKDVNIRLLILDQIKKSYSGKNFLYIIVAKNYQDKIDQDSLSDVVLATLNNPKVNNDYDTTLAVIKCIPYISEKCKSAIIMKNMKFAKYMDSIPETIQMKMIKKNPFNIRYINNPSKTVVDTALQMNPDVKDYMR